MNRERLIRIYARPDLFAVIEDSVTIESDGNTYSCYYFEGVPLTVHFRMAEEFKLIKQE